MAQLIYAVLTGDVISSSQANSGQGNRVLTWIERTEIKLKENFPGLIHGDIDVFRGDSWQMVVQDPGQALRIALFFRTTLLATAGIDSRVGIGFGGIDFLPPENISTGTGAAFTLSGAGLSDLRKPVRMVFKFPPTTRGPGSRALNMILELIDLQVQRWTRKQAEAVSGALVGLTQQEIAESWVADPVSQQAISQHLESAGWSQINQGLQYIEDTLPALLQGLG